MSTLLPASGFKDQLELRRKNRATVEQYMRTNGKDRLRRHELFTPNGSGGSWNTETGEPLVFKGHAKLAALGGGWKSAFQTGSFTTCGCLKPTTPTTSGWKATAVAKPLSRAIRKVIAKTITSIPSNWTTARSRKTVSS